MWENTNTFIEASSLLEIRGKEQIQPSPIWCHTDVLDYNSHLPQLGQAELRNSDMHNCFVIPSWHMARCFWKREELTKVEYVTAWEPAAQSKKFHWATAKTLHKRQGKIWIPTTFFTDKLQVTHPLTYTHNKKETPTHQNVAWTIWLNT